MFQVDTNIQVDIKTQVDFILLIFNCQKYAYKAQKQKETWLPNIPDELLYFHVLGNPGIEKDFIIDDENHILYVKTDDDQFVSPENIRFFRILMNTLAKKKPEYGGHIITVNNPYRSEYYRLHPELPKNLVVMPTKYCSGRFYFLSREAVESLLKPTTQDKIKAEYLEDYAIGYNIPNQLKTNMMHLETSKYFTDLDFS